MKVVRLIRPDPAQLRLDGREPWIGHDIGVGWRKASGRIASGQPGGEVDRGLLADLWHPEAIEHPCQRPADPRPGDPAMEVLGALAREALERLQVLHGQPEEIGPRVDHPALEQLRQDRPAGAFDVHPATPDEMAELLGEPRGTGRVRAVDPDRALVLDDRRPADGAGGRHLELALRAGASLDDRADDLGDHVAGLLEHDRVADPDVLAPHLVEVVEGCPGDRRAGHLGRRQVRDRGQGPGPTDVRDDVLDDRLDLLGWELEGDRPAGCAADHAEARLVVVAVDLDHDAVGLVGQRMACLAPAFGEGDHPFDIELRFAFRIDRQTDGRETLERRGLGRHGVAVLDQLVEPGRQLPTGGHGRIDLAERARAAVARIGIQREAGLLALLVDPLELGLGHEDFAASLERRRLGQPGRDDRDRAQVGGDVLAGRPVTARGTLDEPTALVAQADRQAVDLELGHVAKLRRGLGRRRKPEPLARARIERPQLVVAERVGQRQHRSTVADLVERASRRPAHALGRRFGRGQLRVRRFERNELAEQRVVVGVAQLRRVLRVVQLVGPLDLRGEVRVARGRRGDVEARGGVDERLVDRRELDRHALSPPGGHVGYRTASGFPAAATRR